MPIVHIPTADGYACGTRSLAADANSGNLCVSCYRVLVARLGRAMVERFWNTAGFKCIGRDEARRRADLVLDDVFGEPGSDGRR